MVESPTVTGVRKDAPERPNTGPPGNRRDQHLRVLTRECALYCVKRLGGNAFHFIGDHQQPALGVKALDAIGIASGAHARGAPLLAEVPDHDPRCHHVERERDLRPPDPLPYLAEHDGTFPFKDFPALLAVLEGQRDYAELWEHRTGRIVTHVFTNHGKPIRNYYAAWRSACKRAGLEGRYMHDNRRSAVRNMDRAGIPRDIAKRLSGHKTDSMYTRYNIVDEQDLNDATAKLGQREGVEKIPPVETNLEEAAAKLAES